MTDAEMISFMKRIEEKINNLIKDKKKKTWVKVGVIGSVTGWDHLKMATARNNGLVEYKRTTDGKYEYVLESIPEMFILENPSL